MEQLPKNRWHQHPAAKPPWPILEPPVVLQSIVGELGRSRGFINGYSDPELIAGVYAESEASKTRAYGWGETGSQCP